MAWAAAACGVSLAAGATGAVCAAAGCGADASSTGAEAACPVAAAGPGARLVTRPDEIQASCGTLFAIISLAAPPYDCHAKLPATPTQTAIRKRVTARVARLRSDGFSPRNGSFLNSAGRTVASTDGAPTCGPAEKSAAVARTDGPVICGPMETSAAVTRTDGGMVDTLGAVANADGSAACGTVGTSGAVTSTDGSAACGTVATLDAVTGTAGSAACGTADTLDAVAGADGSDACSLTTTSTPSVQIGGPGMSRVARCASLDRASSTPLQRSVAANGATATP